MAAGQRVSVGDNGDECDGDRSDGIDDVMTTGATAEVCAKVLTRAKVSTVNILTVGRTIIK